MDASDFLSLMHSPRLARAEGLSRFGMHSWLKEATYIPSALGTELRISSFAIDDLISSWANDTSRLLSAAHDTLLSISVVKSRPQSTAWILVQAYYAAFYYAHVALRLTKTSLTYTPTSNLVKIRQLLDAYGVPHPFRLTTNQYIIKFTEIGPLLAINQRSGGDGTHQNTWVEVGHLVGECKAIGLTKAMDTKTTAAIEALSSRLLDIINRAGSVGKGLSEIRNDVQYRQLHGVWPPYGSILRGDYCLRKVLEIKSNKTNIDSFDIDNNDVAVSFLNSCFLFCWVVENFVQSVASSSSKSFLRGKDLKW
jgi:hypothetical protein